MPGVFSWARLGHVSTEGSDSTLWAGTEGACTPCHQDTYGENLVCQVAGTKLWTLFSPSHSASLRPSRVPYEESSVYSLVNWHSLDNNTQQVLDGLSQAEQYVVSLSPGDVLYVPRLWWHHVVTTSPWSLSVNTWLHHPADNKARLAEALVRWQVANFISGLSATTRRLVLNPNEDDLTDTNIEDISELVKQIKRQPTSDVSESEYFSYKYDGKVERLKPSAIQTPASSLSSECAGDSKDSIYSSSMVKVLNSLTQQDVIAAAVQNVLSSDL